MLQRALLFVVLALVGYSLEMLDSGQLLDTKLLGKPKAYTNNRQDWATFKFVTKSYIGAISERMLARLEGTEGQPGAVTLAQMGDEARAEAHTMTFLLTQILTGSSLQILMNCERGNGSDRKTPAMRAGSLRCQEIRRAA